MRPDQRKYFYSENYRRIESNPDIRYNFFLMENLINGVKKTALTG